MPSVLIAVQLLNPISQQQAAIDNEESNESRFQGREREAKTHGDGRQTQSNVSWWLVEDSHGRVEYAKVKSRTTNSEDLDDFEVHEKNQKREYSYFRHEDLRERHNIHIRALSSCAHEGAK
ncbi:hypothetical protein F5Y19DRAFT_477387 [Xylariaceae sp. FL1651]|nr:hypothetical protein F5Y19DRAFT_477387 [Xylariaceae sp. FL1651]